MNNTDIEELRDRLLDEVYAMAFSGTPTAILDEDKIKSADADELFEIAKRFGMTI